MTVAKIIEALKKIKSHTLYLPNRITSNWVSAENVQKLIVNLEETEKEKELLEVYAQAVQYRLIEAYLYRELTAFTSQDILEYLFKLKKQLDWKYIPEVPVDAQDPGMVRSVNCIFATALGFVGFGFCLPDRSTIDDQLTWYDYLSGNNVTCVKQWAALEEPCIH